MLKEKPTYYDNAANEIQEIVNKSGLSDEVRIRICFSMIAFLWEDMESSNRFLQVMEEELGIPQNHEVIQTVRSIAAKYQQADQTLQSNSL